MLEELFHIMLHPLEKIITLSSPTKLKLTTFLIKIVESK